MFAAQHVACLLHRAGSSLARSSESRNDARGTGAQDNSSDVWGWEVIQALLGDRRGRDGRVGKRRRPQVAMSRSHRIVYL